jgi:vesicle transport protein SEC22
MVKLTMIVRLRDGLPLCEGLELDKVANMETYKQQAKSVIKSLAQSKTSAVPPKMTVESGNYFFHYLINSGVCYFTLAEKGYPKKLAYQYLEELFKEFTSMYHSEIESVSRPYAFIKFDKFIQKTRKLYLDTRTQRNMTKLNEELNEVQHIMTKNIQEVLGQGEKLENVSRMSSTLSYESRKYKKNAKALSRQALIKKYMPFAIIGGVILFVLFFRWLFY